MTVEIDADINRGLIIVVPADLEVDENSRKLIHSNDSEEILYIDKTLFTIISSVSYRFNFDVVNDASFRFRHEFDISNHEKVNYTDLIFDSTLKRVIVAQEVRSTKYITGPEAHAYLSYFEFRLDEMHMLVSSFGGVLAAINNHY